MSGSAGAPGTAAPVARPADLVRAFLRSPFEAASWWATLAIILGLGVTLLSAAALSVCFSTGGSLLIWLVGIPIIALGLEVSRLVARVERWRMTLVDPRPLVAHPYQPLNGCPARPTAPGSGPGPRPQFLDGNRWRDVVYVLVLFPLAILEFAISMAFWLTGVAPCSRRRWSTGHPVRRVARAVPAHVPVSDARRRQRARVPRRAPPGAGRLRRLAGAHGAPPGGRPGPPVRRPDGGAPAGRRAAPGQPLGGPRGRGHRAATDRARPPRRRPAAPRVALDRPRARGGPDRHRPGRGEGDRRATRGPRRGWRWPSSATSCAGTMPAILVDRGLEAALAAVAAGCPGARRPSISTLAAGRAAVRRPSSGPRTSWSSRRSRTWPSTARATRCEVAVRARIPRALVIEVRDDGVGGAAAAAGGGLAGLRDRVAGARRDARRHEPGRRSDAWSAPSPAAGGRRGWPARRDVGEAARRYAAASR